MSYTATHRILLVEDDPSVRRSVQLLLTGHGYEVRAYGHAVGLELDPEACKADCLICDLFLPGANAIELLQNLRARAWGGPAILITGFLSPEYDRVARQAGYGAILEKPVPDSRLVKEVVALLSPASSSGSTGG